MVCLLVTCVIEQRESVKKTIHVKNKKIQTDDNSVWWMNPNHLDSNLLQFLCSLCSLLLHIQYIMKFKDWTLSESVTRGLCHIVPDMMRKHWRGSCGEAVMDEQPDGTWARGNTSPMSEAGAASSAEWLKTQRLSSCCWPICWSMEQQPHSFVLVLPRWSPPELQRGFIGLYWCPPGQIGDTHRERMWKTKGPAYSGGLRTAAAPFMKILR